MKNIKISVRRILQILPLVFFLIIIGGCKKFLDKKPLYSTLDDLHQGVLEGQSLGMYNVLRNYAGFSGLPWLDFNSIRDDDAQKGSIPSDGAEITSDFETFHYNKSNAWAEPTYWNDHYYMINLANKLIYYADSLKATDAASMRNVGEAYFFRAYSFFELVKAYGDVPLINFYYTDAKKGIIAKSPASEIYTQIDADLAKAAAYLPLNWNDASGKSTYPGRLTSGAANTLWAQTHLQRGNWSQVVALCNIVKLSNQYSLQDFADIWRDQKGADAGGKNGKESIFEMQCTIGAAGGDWGSALAANGCTWGTQQAVRGSGAWNLGWGWNTPTQNLVSAWDDQDPRKALTILYSGQNDGVGGFGNTVPAYPAVSAQPYWNKKVYIACDPVTVTYTGFGTMGNTGWINHRILRYADVLLMLAEASNELGDGATAATCLELIRNRASGNLGASRTIVPPVAFVNKDQMRTAIKNERRFEFAMEGYRFNDLVRWTPATDGIDAPSVLGSLGYAAKNALYPIPQAAIDLSGGVLVQNSNY